MRMLKHGRLTSGGATLLDYFLHLVLCDQRTRLANVLMAPGAAGRGAPARSPFAWSCRMSNALRCEILLIVCNRSLGFMSHFRSSETFFPDWFPYVGVHSGAFSGSRTVAAPLAPRRKTPRVRFSRPTSVTSAAAARGKPQDGARGHPAAHRTRTRRKGGRRTHPSLQPLRAASRGGSRSAARRTAAASRSPLGFRRLDAPAQGAYPS